MKKLEKLKLNHLSDNVLDEKQQNVLKGGSSCYCSCSGCSCSIWNGTGSIPPGQSSTDMGYGSSNGNSASMRISYL